MKIKLLVSRATLTGSQNRLDVIDVPSDEAERMVAAGQAEIVRDKPAPEKATKRAKTEKATK